MSAPLLNVDEVVSQATKLSAELQRVTLADVLSDVEVVHQLVGRDGNRCRHYHIRLNFIDPKEYKEVFLFISLYWCLYTYQNNTMFTFSSDSHCLLAPCLNLLKSRW